MRKSKYFWTTAKLTVLHEMVAKKGLPFDEAGKVLRTTAGACERKYLRTDWEGFFSGKKAEKQNEKWTDEELKTLYVLRRESRSPVTYV